MTGWYQQGPWLPVQHSDGHVSCTDWWFKQETFWLNSLSTCRELLSAWHRSLGLMIDFVASM